MTFFMQLQDGYCYSTCGVNGSTVKVPQCDYNTLRECWRGVHGKCVMLAYDVVHEDNDYEYDCDYSSPLTVTH